MEFNGKQPETNLKEDVPRLPPVYWTSTRREIHAWLNEQAPSLAELYKSAVHLIFEIPLSSQVRLVSHCVREICNRLVVVKLGVKSGGRLDYVKRMNEITNLWQEKGFTIDGLFPEAIITSQLNLPSSSPDVSLPRELFVEIAKLIKEHEATSSELQERAMRFFLELIPENQRCQNSLRPMVIQWKNLTEWFVGKAHDDGTIDAKYNKQELLSRFELFESFLGTLACSFYSTTDELDEILEDANF